MGRFVGGFVGFTSDEVSDEVIFHSGSSVRRISDKAVRHFAYYKANDDCPTKWSDCSRKNKCKKEFPMLLNLDRKTVQQHEVGKESKCPDCMAPLVARRGDMVVWHWAHYPGWSSRDVCGHCETGWHLACKQAYLSFPGWDIECPISAAGQTFRADAMNAGTARVREFVHSLSPHYLAKHKALAGAGFDVLWILDGSEFASLRSKSCRNGGRKGLLKPRAYDFVHSVGGKALVHYSNKLWRLYMANVWYPCTGPASLSVLEKLPRQAAPQCRENAVSCHAGRGISFKAARMWLHDVSAFSSQENDLDEEIEIYEV